MRGRLPLFSVVMATGVVSVLARETGLRVLSLLLLVLAVAACLLLLAGHVMRPIAAAREICSAIALIVWLTTITERRSPRSRMAGLVRART
jgi:hypothetical protein